MAGPSTHEVVVTGSGPNGLAAAITCAQAGRRVLVLEAADTLGGGVRSSALTLPGLVHDVCSAFYPLGVGSPFLRRLPLKEHGLRWIHPPSPLAHPFDDGTAAVLERSVEATAETLGQDGEAYRRWMSPFLPWWEALLDDVLAPLHFPRHPLLLARFGWDGIHSARFLAKARFNGNSARGLFAGLAAHSQQSLDSQVTGAYGLILGLLGHTVGWPIVEGGSQRLSEALGSYLRSLGGEIRLGCPVDKWTDLPPARVYLFDVSPRELLRIMGPRLPQEYRRRLENYRYGPGVFKMDWALDGPIPWKTPECARAGTVHVGGAFEEIVESEQAIARGAAPPRPFVLVGQQSLFDPTRAPAGRHTAWAYCHVPNGSTVDMSERIENQLERFAPGFRDRVLARHVFSPWDLEKHNRNCVGGDIAGGAMNLIQIFARPVFSRVPYATPVRGVYLCSASTPPGGGVHGLCGYFAACAALRGEF